MEDGELDEPPPLRAKRARDWDAERQPPPSRSPYYSRHEWKPSDERDQHGEARWPQGSRYEENQRVRRDEEFRREEDRLSGGRYESWQGGGACTHGNSSFFSTFLFLWEI